MEMSARSNQDFFFKFLCVAVLPRLTNRCQNLIYGSEPLAFETTLKYKLSMDVKSCLLQTFIIICH